MRRVAEFKKKKWTQKSENYVHLEHEYFTVDIKYIL